VIGYWSRTFIGWEPQARAGGSHHCGDEHGEGGKPVVVVGGRHDHQLAQPWRSLYIATHLSGAQLP
jgi:hypothetical protein